MISTASSTSEPTTVTTVTTEPSDTTVATDSLQTTTEPGDTIMATDSPQTTTEPGDTIVATDSPQTTTEPGDTTMSTTGVVGGVGNQSSGDATAGAAIGGVIALLLLVLIIVLIALYVGWNKKKKSYKVKKSVEMEMNTTQMHNPTYVSDGQLAATNFNAMSRTGLPVLENPNYDYACKIVVTFTCCVCVLQTNDKLKVNVNVLQPLIVY